MPDWNFLWREFSHRFWRVLLVSGGIAFALTLVLMLDLLGDGFSNLATVPFKTLNSDLIIQRSSDDSKITQQRGIILPYSAQRIEQDELTNLKNITGVSRLRSFVLLWNFGEGRFFSISGVPFNDESPLVGPARVRDWIVKGRLPKPGAREVLVELHYGIFYKLIPGATLQLNGETFTVAGLVDIKEGSQIVASNIYMDIKDARRLGSLPPGSANQIFITVDSAEQTQAVKDEIISKLPQASITSANSLLKLFGGISQMATSLKALSLMVAVTIAIAVIAILVLGALAERKRDAAILQSIGWNIKQVRTQLIAEMTLVGMLGGLFGAVISVVGADLLGQLAFDLPTNLGHDNPAEFVAGAWQSEASRVTLPISLPLWKLIMLPVAGGIMCVAFGWSGTTRISKTSTWEQIKST